MNTLVRLFELYDADGSGLVSANEVANALRGGKSKRRIRPGRASGLDIFQVEEIEDILLKFDSDGNRELDLREFIEAFKDVI